MNVISFPSLNWFIKSIKFIANFSNNQWKKLSLSFGVFGLRNQVVFRKIKPNPFLVIEKATSTFQNFHEFMSETSLSNERHFFRKVENLI